MNENNLDHVKLADRVIDRRLLSEGTKGVPRKAILVELDHLKDPRVPVNQHVEPVRLRGRILKIDHIDSKPTTNSGGNCAAEYLVLVHDERLICSIRRRGIVAIVANPSTTWKGLEGSSFRWRNGEASSVQHRLSRALTAVKPELGKAGNRLFD